MRSYGSSVSDGSGLPVPVGSLPRGGRSGGGSATVKRMLDMLFAGCGLVALAPVIAGVAIAIRVSMGAPVFFRQQRPGLHAKPFELLKFRSMLHEVGPNGQTLTQDQRVTRLGSFLR